VTTFYHKAAMIDELDRQIIEQLAKDARQSSKLIAKKLYVDASTVRRRIQRLVRDGVIYIAALSSLAKIGLHVAAIVGLDVESRDLSGCIQELCAFPEVNFVSVTTGRFNVMARICCHATADVSSFSSKVLSQIKGVKNCEAFICMNIAKSINPLDCQGYLPPPARVFQKQLARYKD